MGQTVDFIRIFRKLIKYLWVIVVVTVLSGAVGFFMTIRTGNNVYSARVSLYNIGNSANANAMRDYTEIISSKMVADQVVNSLTNYKLNSREIQSMARTSYQENSAIFYIIVNSADPKLSIEIANAVANAFVTQVSIITGQNNVKILDAAEAAVISYNASSEQMKTRLIYVAVGFLIACILISLTEIFSTRVSEVGDSTLNGEIKLLGVIPRHDI